MTAPPKVLVVADNPTVRGGLCAMLERNGHAVLSAGDGREALNLLENSNVALVLSDLEMPGMDGRELLRALRAHPRYARLPVVLMLVYPWDALTIQADAFLVKPFLTINDLRAAFQKAIGPG
ncbi:MAG: response regulator [Chloroflexi bacterium]|nr:response regulator [Chloroflexota bacterium]